ncbi:MAG: oxygen-independent coproporphyrinogen III oxidase, partial [Bacillota bacterium]
MRGLYVHVPFCEKRCHYCDFNTYLLREGGVDQYLEALAQEAALYAARDDVAGVEFDTLYIGGGGGGAPGPGRLARGFLGR